MHRPFFLEFSQDTPQKQLAIESLGADAVQVNTPTNAIASKVARVAVYVRLYFDVQIDSEDPVLIQRVARQELERVADEEQIRIKKLRFPNVYPVDTWYAIRTGEFQICQICTAKDANAETRFSL